MRITCYKDFTLHYSYDYALKKETLILYVIQGIKTNYILLSHVESPCE